MTCFEYLVADFAEEHTGPLMVVFAAATLWLAISSHGGPGGPGGPGGYA